MNKEFLTGRVIKAENGRISVVVTDETVDRSGESLPISSWDLTNFMKSPRMFADHDYSIGSITGKWENVRKENGKLIMDPVFHELTDLAKINKSLVESGFLDTTSVGFLRKAQKDGSVINELFEVSWVGVPCNPNARVLSAEAMAAVKAFAGVEGDEEAQSNEEEAKPAEQEEAPKEEPKAEETKPEDEAPAEGQEQAQEEKAEEKGIIDDTNAQHQAMMQVKRGYLDKIWLAVWRFCDAYCSDAVGPESITQMVDDLAEQMKGIASLESQPMSDDEMEEVMMGIKSFLEQKAGRVLSGKNRGIIGASIESMSASISTLKELLDATQPEEDEKGKQLDTEKKGTKPEGDHTKVIEAFKSFNASSDGASIRLLRIIHTATRDALHQARKRRV